MTGRMKPKIKKQWVAALRSGEYKQTTGYLSRGGGYCCLGVLCELAVQAGVATSREGMDFTSYEVNDDSDFSVLPQGVIEWAGIEGIPEDSDIAAPGVYTSALAEDRRIKGTVVSLTTLNDSLKFDFNQIADIIEKEF